MLVLIFVAVCLIYSVQSDTHTTLQFCLAGPAENGPRSQVLLVAKHPGKEVKVKFFYPTKSSLIGSASLERSGEEFWDESSSEFTTFSSLNSFKSDLLAEKDEIETDEPDLNCQWEFRAENSSQYLLMTFSRLSAPFSENCKDAYVAMKKETGYESRWCGNRRQGNARPIALFSKSSAQIRVFRRSSASQSPATGFSVAVTSMDAAELSGVKSSLRFSLIG